MRRLARLRLNQQSTHHQAAGLLGQRPPNAPTTRMLLRRDLCVSARLIVGSYAMLLGCTLPAALCLPSVFERVAGVAIGLTTAHDLFGQVLLVIERCLDRRRMFEEPWLGSAGHSPNVAKSSPISQRYA